MQFRWIFGLLVGWAVGSLFGPVFAQKTGTKLVPELARPPAELIRPRSPSTGDRSLSLDTLLPRINCLPAALPITAPTFSSAIRDCVQTVLQAEGITGPDAVELEGQLIEAVVKVLTAGKPVHSWNQKYRKTIADLRNNDWGVLHTEGIGFDNAELRRAYDDVFKRRGDVPRIGQRFVVDLPVAPVTNRSYLDTIRLQDLARFQVNKWALTVLRTTQTAFPQENLAIEYVSLGRGWNVGSSEVHVDEQGTHLHALCTTLGESVIIFLPAAMMKIIATNPGDRKISSVSITAKFPNGDLEVTRYNEFGGTEFAMDRALITADEYVQVRVGQTGVISGRDRETAMPGTEATSHASPLFSDEDNGEDRLTLFMGIQRRQR